MKIIESIERECCQSQDLKRYLGQRENTVCRFSPKFCIHCGQIWVVGKEMGPAGSLDAVLKPVTIGLESWKMS